MTLPAAPLSEISVSPQQAAGYQRGILSVLSPSPCLSHPRDKRGIFDTREEFEWNPCSPGDGIYAPLQQATENLQVQTTYTTAIIAIFLPTDSLSSHFNGFHGFTIVHRTMCSLHIFLCTCQTILNIFHIISNI